MNIAPLNVCPPPPRVTFRRVVVSLRGPGQSPVRPFACCVGSLRSVGRCPPLNVCPPPPLLVIAEGSKARGQ